MEESIINMEKEGYMPLYVKNNRVLDGVMDIDLTEYSSHALADAMNKDNRNG